MAQLRHLATQPTIEQLRLARLVDMPLDATTPQPVAAAMLRRHIGDALELPVPDSVTDGVLDYLSDLAGQTNVQIPENIHDRDEADSWVRVLHAVRAADHLEILQPAVGDIVQVYSNGDESLAEVASISADGQLNFRGGHGNRARPHRVGIFARTSNTDVYASAQYQARQQAAARIKNPQNVGPGKLSELDRWKVAGTPSQAARHALIEALDSANEERPMQVVLEQHPQILSHLVTGHGGSYVVPQVSFKAYVADFLVAGYTSAGIQWTLVELESPTAKLTIGDGQASKQIRRAQQQIVDWREWLMSNLDYARRTIRDNGLGLAGIRPDARGLIIVGRGPLSDDTDVARIRIEREQRIVVRTYDWLIRQSSSKRGLPIGMLDFEVPDAVEDEGW